MTAAEDRFVELVQGPEAVLAASLDEAALIIAAGARPDLDVAAYRARLDLLAAGCPAPTLDALTGHLFRLEGFRGNVEDYYDPANSYLDQVLDRRVGIPITLALVAIEVGRRLDIPLAGVGMPGHFLLRHLAEPRVILDPFDRGRALDWADCEARFRAVQGPDAPFEAAFLDPVGPRLLLARMLANLKDVHERRGEGAALERVLRLRTAIPGVAPADRIRLATLLAHRGRFAEAATALDELAAVSDPSGGDRLRARASLLRARLN